MLLEDIVADIDWRTAELASLRTIPLRYRMDSSHSALLVKYSVPAIYALWEGFVKKTFIEYNHALNGLSLQYGSINTNLATHALNSIDVLNLKNARTNFSTQIKYTECFMSTISNSVVFEDKLPTDSNVNFDVITDILQRYNLRLIDKSYKKKLNKLLEFRNKIAHGDNKIPVKYADVESFVNLVQDLMNEIYDIIEEGWNNRSYMK